MAFTNGIRTSVIIFIAIALQNLILLFFFGIAINRQTIIVILIFTLVLTLALKQLGIQRDNG